MCKLAYVRTRDDSAYSRVIKMIEFQENVVAGQSTGITFRKTDGSFSTRKAKGKINSFIAKYPDMPSSREALGHSRWATVGVINIDNQHPISIMYKGKKIGYGVHNGSFTDYEAYEHYRNDGVVNKTDSALLFAIYGRVLRQFGDSRQNRIRAFSYLMNIIKNEMNHNLILMFKDGQVLFGGNKLTYQVDEDKVGIMTFGLENSCVDGFVYEIHKMKVFRHNMDVPHAYLIRKPVDKPTRSRFGVRT